MWNTATWFNAAVAWQIERVPDDPDEQWSAITGVRVQTGLMTLAAILTPFELVVRGPWDVRLHICIALYLLCAGGALIVRTTGKARLASAFTHISFTMLALWFYGDMDPYLTLLFGVLGGIQAMVLVGDAVGWSVLMTFLGAHALHRGLPAFLAGDHEVLLATAVTAVTITAIGAIISSIVSEQRRSMILRKEQRVALQHARDVAEETSAAQSGFLANTSHEVRTPMNGVLGLLEVVGDSELTADQRMLIDTARRSAVGLLSILDGILDLSKLDAGAFALSPAPCDVASLARDTARLLESTARQGVSVQAQVGEVIPPWVHLDGTRLRQVLMNLVSNAVKFTHDGEVKLVVDFIDGMLLVEVRDTGIGMTPEQLGRVFDPFQQADTSTSRRYGGTGLGLTICQRLVTLMGGHLVADSTKGVGSRFQFCIPAEICEGPAAKAESAPESRRLRVLVADDDPVNRLVAERMITSTGHDIVLATDGQQALEIVTAGGVDLVLMDRQMPHMDGLAATRAVRALSGNEGQIPIVALTASAMAADRDACLRAGMDEVLTKPYTREQMNGLLARYAGRIVAAV